MSMSKGSWGWTLEPTIKAWAMDEYASIPSLIPDLYGEETSIKSVEHYQTATAGSGFQQFTGTVYEEDFISGYSKDITNVSYSDSFSVTHDEYEDDLYGIMSERAKRLGELAATTKEQLALSLFNHAFDTSINTVDGANANPLCYGSHPSNANSNTQNNLGTTALSYAALVASRTMMMKWKTDAGRPMLFVPDTLIVPIDLETTAREVCESLFKGASSDFTTNIIASTYRPKIIVSQYLTDTNNWFYAISKDMMRYNKWQNREPLRLIASEDVNSLVLRETGYFRIGFGSYDWRWIFGANVAGA